MKLVIRRVVSTLALFAAAYLMPNIRVEDPSIWIVYALMALILVLVNAVIHPLLKPLSCLLVILTLCIVILAINGACFFLAACIAEALGIGFYVDGFLSALLSALIVSNISMFFNIFLKDNNEEMSPVHK